VLRRVVAVLLVLVMFGSAVVPAALAAGLDINVTIPSVAECNKLGDKEIKVINAVSGAESVDYLYTEKTKRWAEIYHELAKKEILDSVKETGRIIATTTKSTVMLGSDTTFYTSDSGDHGSSSWGVAPTWYGSQYYLSSNKVEAATLLGPGGYGSASAWGWVGKSFYVSGTGTKPANIIMRGHIYGLTSAVAGGNSNVEINLVVYDTTTGAKYTTTIYQKSEGGLGWTGVDKDFNNGISVNLQGGHTYIVYIEVITSGAVYGTGEAGSDFGRFDGDYLGEGAWFYEITIDF